MNKPTYYLWQSNTSLTEELQKQKLYYQQLGFRVVILRDGNKNRNVHLALKAIIKNHGKECIH